MTDWRGKEIAEAKKKKDGKEKIPSVEQLLTTFGLPIEVTTYSIKTEIKLCSQSTWTWASLVPPVAMTE